MRIAPALYHLHTALEQVRERHPFRGQAPDTVSGSLIDEVREKLEASSFENLHALAFSFNIREILACLEILVHDRDNGIVKKAAEIFKIRPREQVILQGWFKLVKFYPHDVLEQTLKGIIGVKGFGILEKSEKVSSQAPTWFVSNRLSEGIFRDYQNSGHSENLDIYLSNNFLNVKDGIFKESWRTLLIKGNGETIKKEKSKRVLVEYIRAENAQYLQPFGQHYLNALKTRKIWAESILEFIVDKYGAPYAIDSGSDIETPFWRKVSKNAKSEFRTWYILKSIDEFFEGVRADFWKQYVQINKVERVKKILDGDGFMLDFGSFGVVEFKNIGNAAYIYPKQVFENYWGNSDFRKQPYWFKDKNETIRSRSFSGWDGRIIHREEWQIGTSIKINRLLGIR